MYTNNLLKSFQFPIGSITSSILRIIFTTWVANWSCPFFDNKVSNTFCSFMSVQPLLVQSMPWYGWLDYACIDFDWDKALSELSPEFSAKAIGICYKASANARTAYCSVESIVFA